MHDIYIKVKLTEQFKEYAEVHYIHSIVTSLHYQIEIKHQFSDETVHIIFPEDPK